MILKRRNPSAASSSKNVPALSGPRCTMVFIIFSSTCSLFSIAPTNPVNPHMYCSPSIFLLFHSCCLLFTQRRCRNCHTDVTLTLYPHLFIKTTCFFLLNFPCTLCLLTITVPSHIKFRIDRIEILTVQIILHDSKTFTKALVMHDFTLTQETNRITHFRIFYET